MHVRKSVMRMRRIVLIILTSPKCFVLLLREAMCLVFPSVYHKVRSGLRLWLRGYRRMQRVLGVSQVLKIIAGSTQNLHKCM